MGPFFFGARTLKAFRLFQNSPVQFNNDGTVCSGGEVRIYENNSTTPTNAGEGPDLSPSLGSTLSLDASGRLEDDAWLPSGSYRVRLYDADGALQWSLDNVQDVATGGITPLDPADGEEGQVYKTDGSPGGAYWGDVLEVPDCTGNGDKYLGNDGLVPGWRSFPAATVYDSTNLPGGITQGSTSFQIGKMLVQTGTGTIPSSGTLTSNVAVVFGTAYATLLHVDIQITGSGGSTPQGAKPGVSYVGSLTGFTAYAYAADEHDTPGWFLTSGTSFTYVAFGLVA